MVSTRILLAIPSIHIDYINLLDNVVVEEENVFVEEIEVDEQGYGQQGYGISGNDTLTYLIFNFSRMIHKLLLYYSQESINRSINFFLLIDLLNILNDNNNHK